MVTIHLLDIYSYVLALYLIVIPADLLSYLTVLTFSRSDPEADKLPLTKTDRGLSNDVIFGTTFNQTSEKLGRLFQDPVSRCSVTGIY